MNTTVQQNLRRWLPLLIALLLLTVAGACRGKQTMASKSAEAYREASENGLAVGGNAHGGHEATASETDATMDHSTMGGMDTDGSSMPGMDHSKMQQGGTMAGMDHSKMKQGAMAGTDHSKMKQGSMAGMDHSMQSGSMAGMDHSKMQSGTMAGMDHSKMPAASQPGMPGMNHSTMAGIQPGGKTTSAVEVKSSQARPGQTAMTLSADPLDAPAPTSVVDAARSAEMAEMMSSGGHGMVHGTYVQQDAGRDTVEPSPERGVPPGSSSGHDMSSHTVAPAQPQRIRSTPASASPQQTGGHSLHRPAPASTPATATIYTCPMHPEVKSDRPGKCPKCAMTLVKKEKK